MGYVSGGSVQIVQSVVGKRRVGGKLLATQVIFLVPFLLHVNEKMIWREKGRFSFRTVQMDNIRVLFEYQENE